MNHSKINLFKQMRAFYSFVFNSERDITPLHSSLYMFLLNQNNRANWVEWFKCPADTAMFGALIHSNKTYYKVLNDLVDFGLIEVQKGVANLKPPKIKILKLKYADSNDDVIEIPTPEMDTMAKKTSVDTTPILTPILTQLSTPILTQLHTQLSTLLPTLKDKQDTKILITIKEEEEKKGNKIFPFKKSCLDLGIDADVLDDWLKIRKTKKTTNSETAFNSIKSQIEKAFLSPTNCIEIAVIKSWGGFQADWLDKVDYNSLLGNKVTLISTPPETQNNANNPYHTNTGSYSSTYRTPAIKIEKGSIQF